MRRKPVRTSLSVLFLGLIGLMQPQAGYSTVEETLAELNAKPAEERQKLLVENAKKEGAVTLYTATNIRDTQEVLAGFNKNYPFVKVSFSSLGGPGVLNKILTEYRAGMHAADVVILTGNNAVELIDKKIVGKYKSPMCRFCAKDLSMPRATGPESTPSDTRSFTTTRESARKTRPSGMKIC